MHCNLSLAIVISLPSIQLPEPNMYCHFPQSPSMNFEVRLTNLRISKLTTYSFLCSDYYFTNLVWADNQTVSVTWMDRAQTMNIVMLCKAANGNCIEVTLCKILQPEII